MVTARKAVGPTGHPGCQLLPNAAAVTADDDQVNGAVRCARAAAAGLLVFATGDDKRRVGCGEGLVDVDVVDIAVAVARGGAP